MRSRGAGATLALVLALVVPSGAAAQSLRFVSPASPRDVSLPLTTEKERRGSITVVIRNVSGVTGLLELRFFPDRGRPVRLVGGENPGSKLAHAKPAKRVVFRRNQYRGIQVTFALPKKQRLSRVNGMLVAQLRARGPGKSQKFPKAAQLRIRGTSPAVQFSPNEVSLKVRENCWLFDFGECGREAHVLIRGEDVAALPTEGPAVGHVVLGNGDGGEASLELSDVAITGNALTGTVKVTDHSGVGDLEGSLPLAPGVAGGPDLPVSVKVGHSLGVAVLVVFLGAALGGLVARLRAIRRRRKLLGIQLASTLESYDEEKAKSGTELAGYDIDAFAIQPRYVGNRGVRPFPRDQGVSGLLWRITSAQDDQDFDEAAEKTRAFIDVVNWWMRLEPWARETRRQIVERTVPARRDGTKFTKCDAFQATYLLRQDLRNRPDNEDKVQELEHAAAKHCARLNRWRKLWHLHLEVEAARLQLTQEQRDALQAAEIETIQQAIRPKPKKDEKAEKAEARRVAALEESRLDEAEDTLRDLLARADRELDIQVEAQLEDDSREVDKLVELGSVWEIAEPPSLLSRIGGSDREEESSLWRPLREVQRHDLYWTLLSGLVAATAYALTIWDDTWGTITDYATAFTTGFLTDTVVNWAVLPAFQTYRARRRAAAKEAKQSSSLVQDLAAALKREFGTQASGTAGAGSDPQPGGGSPSA